MTLKTFTDWSTENLNSAWTTDGTNEVLEYNFDMFSDVSGDGQMEISPWMFTFTNPFIINADCPTTFALIDVT